VISQPQGRPPTLASARSAPVKIFSTPGGLGGGQVDALMRACACGLRRKQP
jgi:hypothetical protein